MIIEFTNCTIEEIVHKTDRTITFNATSFGEKYMFTVSSRNVDLLPKVEIGKTVDVIAKLRLEHFTNNEGKSILKNTLYANAIV